MRVRGWWLVVAMGVLPASAAAPWAARLFLANGGVWQSRFAVDLDAADAEAGQPVVVPIGSGAGQAPLVGAQAPEVRVTDAAGVELLFDLRGADGLRLTAGPIPAGAQLVVPRPGPGAQRVYVYFDNPATILPPDTLGAGAGLVNGGAESGEGSLPDGWQFDPSDEQHQLTWVSDTAHTGQRAVRCVVAAGAEKTWIGARQRTTGLIAGKRYKLTVWVKGRGVVGAAGWYIHVGAAGNSQFINRVERAGEGTFDWRQLTIEFTAPAKVDALSTGSVLYGSGTAWYDDLRFECLDPVPPSRATAGAVERLTLATVAAQVKVPAGRTRVPLTVTNLGEAATGVLVQAPLSQVTGLLGPDWNVAGGQLVDAAGRACASMVSGADLLFLADLPARSRIEFSLLVGRGAARPAAAVGYSDLLTSRHNLAQNPSFEAGGALPDLWPGASEGQKAGEPKLQRVAGGKFGQWAVRTEVPPAVTPRWVGWRQKVPVEPGAGYYVAVWAKTNQITGGDVRLHAHLLDAQGQVTSGGYWSTGQSLSGTTDWQLLGGRVTMPPDGRQLELHLTMNCHGTVWHDGVLCLRTAEAQVGRIEDATAGGALRVWTVDPIRKVFRESPAGPAATGIDLAAARNAAECAQVCVRTAQAGPVTVTVAAPTARGAALPVTVERVGYVPCFQPAGYFDSKAQPWERRKVDSAGRTDGWRGWWPDWLGPVTGPVAVAAETTQPFWLTVKVPRDAAPGVYQGQVTIAAGGATTRLPLRCEVWRPTLPDRPTLQVIYDSSTLAGTTPEQSWQFLAARHCAPVRPSPDPSFRLVDGRVLMDAAAYDRAATVLFDQLKASAAFAPGIFYATGWAHPPRDFLGQKFGTPGYKAALQSAVKQYWAHVKEKGWADKITLYLSDEPHYDRPEVVKWLGEVIDLYREAVPDMPIYSSTWGHVPAWDGRLNHWGIGQYGDFPLDALAQRRAAGDKVWFTTDGQMEIDTPYNACERLLPYYCFAHDVSGYEFWGVFWYTYDPYQYGWHSFISQSSRPGESSWVRYPNGDGYLAYPGGPLGVKGPVSTIRLEQARAGIEDYELLVALARLAPSHPEAQRLLAEVKALAPIPNAQGFRSTEILPDPEKLTRLRRQVGALLDRLSR